MSNLFAFGDKVIGGGESSQSDGHIIQNPSGTAMPTQPNLQFADANVSNDGTNNATVVRSFVDIDWDDWQEVDDNDDTYYRVKDAPLVDGNVEVDLMKKLWENPAPNASFSAQNITLASDDCDFVLWIYHFNTGIAYEGSSISQKGENAIMSFGDSGHTYFRAVTAVNNTVYTINNATNDGTTDNTYIIPIAVYGIKQKVTISLSAIISNVSTSAENCMMPDGVTSVAETLNNTKVIETTSPTVDQLKTADIIISKVRLVGTSAYTEIVTAFGDGTISIGLSDYAGTHLTVYTAWNKTNGTLVSGCTNTSYTTAIDKVKLIYLNKG